MVIGSIVIAGGYFVFSFIREKQLRFTSNSDSTYHLNSFYKSFNYLNFKCDSITMRNNIFSYHIREKQVVFEPLETAFVLGADTLFCDLNDVVVEKLKDESKVFSLSLFFKYDGLDFQWLFTKDYGSTFQQLSYGY